MNEIEKAKELKKVTEELTKSSEKIKFYENMMRSDIKAGRDPFNSELKLKYEIKHHEELERKFNRLKLV